MLESLYSKPLRVYLSLLILCGLGIYAGLNLSISLFPNSVKPEVNARIVYGQQTAAQFLESYGSALEGSLKNLSVNGVKVESVEADYRNKSVRYDIKFNWGVPSEAALKEVENVVQRTISVLPDEVRRRSSVSLSEGSGGFFAASFYSETKNVDEIYRILEPIFAPELSQLQDAQEAVVWNPTQKEISIELISHRLVEHQLLPEQIVRSLLIAMQEFNAGSVQVGDKNSQIIVKSPFRNWAELAKIPVMTPKKNTVQLGDLANIQLAVPQSNARSFRTSGAPSLILFASPKPDGNIKRLSEQALALIERLSKNLPKDIKYKVLVDPSSFIQSAIENVLHEVFLAAFLAVLVLFVFMGSLKNVITAAIEIPMSILLAFILMKLFGMNLNLISLGGLALSAGMNVDASVVVMENIFRLTGQRKGKLSLTQRLEIVLAAVNEVKLPIIASTLASLVVFVPLIFTTGIASAVLGDLAKAVIFSHGVSAVVALILVPTVRLQLMSGETQTHHNGYFDSYLQAIERTYSRSLKALLEQPKILWTSIASLVVILISLIYFVIPRLPKEVIGKPTTDWVVAGLRTQGNTLSKQMENITESVEAKLLEKYEGRVQYTFTQIYDTNGSAIMLRLKNKEKMESLLSEFEKDFPNSPSLQMNFEAWNPSELPLPDPEDLLYTIKGRDIEKMALATKELKDLILQTEAYRSVRAKPDVENTEALSIKPYTSLWNELAKENRLNIADVADYVRVATEGKSIGVMNVDGYPLNLMFRFPENSVKSVEDVQALPIAIGEKIISLKALANIALEREPAPIVRLDLQSQYSISGRLGREEKHKDKGAQALVATAVAEWRKTSPLASQVTVTKENPRIELDQSLEQLGWAIALSAGLILFTMILQMGRVMNSLLVFVAIPLGLIGVLLALWIFRSTLSLNSLLGVVLLNGIAVANSIILVDFLQRKYDEGLSPSAAALAAGQARLRPILMTSLATLLGMLPVALGFGEGGKILQPLGIAVVGGLWVSTMLTLYIVPALQVSYLEWRSK